MSNAKQLIKQVAESNNISEVKDILRCAFEFEYQDYKDSCGDKEIDYDLLTQRYFDEDHCPSDVAGHISDEHGAAELFKWCEEWGHCWREVAPTTKIECLIEQGIDSHREVWEESELENDRISYEIDNGSDIDDDLPCGLENDRDESVSGGEIKPESACSIQEFVELSNWIHDNRNDFDVDSRCSFHIHLSIEGVDHYYGKNLQAEMIGYILLNEGYYSNDRLINRLDSSNVRYFKPQVKNEKMSFVNFQSAYRTWEFRCFGNIKHKRDFQKSLLLAYNALKHAYRVKLGLSDSLFGNCSNEEKNEILGQFISKDLGANRIILKSRINNAEAERVGA